MSSIWAVDRISWGGVCTVTYCGFDAQQGMDGITFDTSSMFPTPHRIFLFYLAAPSISDISPFTSTLTEISGTGISGGALISFLSVTGGTTSYPISVSGNYILGVALGYRCEDFGDATPAETPPTSSTIPIDALATTTAEAEVAAVAAYFGDTAVTTCTPDSPLTTVASLTHTDGSGNHFSMCVAREHLSGGPGTFGPWSFTTDFPAQNPGITGSVRAGLGITINTD
jgi:hypothetical protein